MNQRKFVSSFAWIAALLVAAPAMGQLLNHPVQALPLGDASGTTFIEAQSARGLNSDSGKQNSFAVGVGRAMDKVSFAALGGYVASATDEVTLGANVAIHLLRDSNAPAQVSIQGGLGWTSLNVLAESVSIMSFPIGVVLQARPSGNTTTVTPWVMPRLDIVRTGSLLTIPSSTSTNFGAAAGLSVTSESGAGAHLALDWANVGGGNPFGFAIGVHYMVGG